MTERPQIENTRDYYSEPEVSSAIIKHLGYAGFLTRHPSLLFSEFSLRSVACEYLVVSNLDIKLQKGTPVRSIKPWQLSNELRKNPTTEIFRSLWSKDAPEQEKIPINEKYPQSQIIAWDVEYYNNSNPGFPFRDQQGTFQKLEPSYRVMEKNLNNYGINHMTVMTGRGYHFLTQIPYSSEVMKEIIGMGNTVEDPIAQMHANVPIFSKRDRPVPTNSELAYKGASYLMQYLFALSINEARERSDLKVEISDRGNEGVAFDSTALVRHVETAKMGALGSLYLKPLVKEEYKVDNTRLLTRVARAVEGSEIDGLSNLIRVRQNYSLAAKNLHDSGGSIPDGSEGISKLISDYKKSELRKLHLEIDSNLGDPPEVWNSTYRKDNYGWISDIDKGLYNIVQNANPQLLQPDSLNYFINTLYDASGWGMPSAGHIRTLLRSIYEDGRFNWGRLFTRHESAMRHASGWTAIILGQRFEQR